MMTNATPTTTLPLDARLASLTEEERGLALQYYDWEIDRIWGADAALERAMRAAGIWPRRIWPRKSGSGLDEAVAEYEEILAAQEMLG